MILTLDIGNSQIFGGVFEAEGSTPTLRFRMASRSVGSSDELGLFLMGVLKKNKTPSEQIKKIAICSVVPELMHTIKNCCVKYFGIEPFVLQAGTKTGLKIKYQSPQELGADRVANSIGAVHLFPAKNLIIYDFGTANTMCVITRQKEYLGGMILPGLKISMEALEANTAKLPSVEIIKPKSIIGRSTIECIQSGLYYGSLCAVKAMVPMIRKECFEGEDVTVIGTGGFSRLFENTDIFDCVIPDLVLIGLKEALRVNV